MQGPTGDGSAYRTEEGHRTNGLRVVAAGVLEDRVWGPIRRRGGSRTSGVAETPVAVWVELYPGYATRSVASERGRRADLGGFGSLGLAQNG